MRHLLLALCLFTPAMAQTQPTNTGDYFLDFNYAQSSKGHEEWVQSIKVLSPGYRTDVKGSVTVEFEAPGMKAARVMLWQQPTDKDPNPWGHDATLATLELKEGEKSSFTFNADEFPNGPMNVRILANDGTGTPQAKRDICELQLYNLGGVKWNQGLANAPVPAPTKGMAVAFEDDFDGPLSISHDGKGAKYNAHKPVFGDFSGWPFTSPSGDGKPFAQVGTYLKICARKPEGTKGYSGLIAPVAMDKSGYWAKPPFYMECRFTAQSAPGTWPAFWTITEVEQGKSGDELDIVEAYGGMGPKNPNHPGYSITSHFWNQKDDQGNKKKGVNKRIDIMNLGGKSYWSTTFHTYGLYVDEKDTVYYFDNIEVLRHPTNPVSMNPHVWLINYAIGGISGWKIDLARYGNGSDMYVDWVRVFEKK